MKRFGRFGRVDPNNPEAAGICQRGGEIRKRSELHEETEWRGGRLVPNGWLVCAQHMDKPNPQIGGQRALPPDPVPVHRPSPFVDPAPVYVSPLLGTDGAPLLGKDGVLLLGQSTGPALT